MSMNVICSLVNTKYLFYIGKCKVSQYKAWNPLLMAVIHNLKCKIGSILVF